MTSNLDKVIAVLRKKYGKHAMPKNLDQKIAQSASLTQIEVRRCLVELKQKGWVKAESWDERGFPLSKMEVVLPPEPPEQYELLWSDACKFAGLSEKEISVVVPAPRCIKNMTAEDMRALVKGLLQLRQDMKDNPSRFCGKRQFDVSAQYLLGSSKLLKSLPSRNLHDFGIPVDQLLGPPRYVLVAGAIKPESTILVENPHSFEAAVLADRESRFCWIATYGYGLSKSDESYGEQIIDVVSKSSSVITLSRRAHYVEFRHAIETSGDHLFFWGDLDLSGLDIYGRLKKLLPSLKLSGLYKPMIEELQKGRGHTYLCAQKDKQALGKFSFDDIEELSKLCSVNAVDQEFVDVEKHLDLSVSGINLY